MLVDYQIFYCRQMELYSFNIKLLLKRFCHGSPIYLFIYLLTLFNVEKKQ